MSNPYEIDKDQLKLLEFLTKGGRKKRTLTSSISTHGRNLHTPISNMSGMAILSIDDEVIAHAEIESVWWEALEIDSDSGWRQFTHGYGVINGRILQLFGSDINYVFQNGNLVDIQMGEDNRNLQGIITELGVDTTLERMYYTFSMRTVG